jgi:hypothetical protein
MATALTILCSACLGQDRSPTAGAVVAPMVSATISSAPTRVTLPIAQPVYRPPTSVPAVPTPTPGLRPTPVCLATPGPTSADSRSLRVAYVADSQLWLWREETGQAVSLADNAETPCVLSPDGSLIAFRRPVDKQSDEIWVVGMDGTGERRVVVTPVGEFIDGGPELRTLLRMGWVPQSHLLWYGRDYADDEAQVYAHGVRVVNADGGLPYEAVPAGEASALDWRPDGRQLAILTLDELRLIDTADGRVTHTVPWGEYPNSSWYRRKLRYSPDSRCALAFAPHALVVVDTVSGRRRDVPLDYEPIPLPVWVHFPSLYWAGRSSIGYVFVSHAQDYQGLYGSSASFSVWRIDLDPAEATELRVVVGSRPSVSPDGHWLTYWRHVRGYDKDLFLADVETGRETVYDRVEPHLSMSPDWHANSERLMYDASVGNKPQLMIGELCGSPVAAPETCMTEPNGILRLHSVEGRDEFLVAVESSSGAGCIFLVAPDGRTQVIADKAIYGGLWLGD